MAQPNRDAGCIYIAIQDGVAAYADRLLLALFIRVLNHCQDPAENINEA